MRAVSASKIVCFQCGLQQLHDCDGGGLIQQVCEHGKHLYYTSLYIGATWHLLFHHTR